MSQETRNLIRKNSTEKGKTRNTYTGNIDGTSQNVDDTLLARGIDVTGEGKKTDKIQNIHTPIE